MKFYKFLADNLPKKAFEMACGIKLDCMEAVQYIFNVDLTVIN